MGCSDAVGTRVATTDDEYVLAFGCDTLVFVKLDASQDAVLLREHLEGEVYAFQFPAWCLEVASRWCACGDYDSVVIRGER